MEIPISPNSNGKSYLNMVTIVAALGGLLFGFDMAVISGVLPIVSRQFQLTAVGEGWFVSSALVGCVIGVACSGELSDRLGRKKLLYFSGFLFFFSALGSTLITSMTWLINARILGGIAVGIASNVVPLYISEIAPAAKRGRLVTFYQLAITIGILLAYLTNSFLLQVSLDKSITSESTLFKMLFIEEIWRGMFSIGAIPAFLFLLGLVFVPESPRWLILKGKKKEAVKIMQKLISPTEINQVLDHTSNDTESGTYKELFSPMYRKALLLGLLLPLFSQFSGINAIIYYGPSILNKAGVSLSNSFLSQTIFGAANLLFTLIAIWKVDQLGRRPLYLVGTAGASISLFLTGLYFYLGYTSSIWLFVWVLIFLACFAFSVGPLKFVVASEIFPSKIRGRALALSIMVMWVADTLIGQLTPIMLRFAGTSFTFWFFSFFCLVAFFVIYKLLPETKGKSLEEIEHFWTDLKEK